MHDRRSPSRPERRIALSFAFALLPALGGCSLYDSAVYGSRKGTVEYPGSGAAAGGGTSGPVAPPGQVQSESLPPPPGAGGEPPTSAAGSLPPPSSPSGPSAGSSGSPPPFGSQPVTRPTGPAPVPLPPTASRAGGTQVAASEQPAMARQRFAWPLRGKVVGKFGPQTGGRQSDGIDIAAPSGAPVKAAESGKVAFVGPLRGLGNVVLVQHSDSYVTAYANTDQAVVKQGDEVRKGQTITTVGTPASGDARLHFEIRRDNKPVDPMALLAN